MADMLLWLETICGFQDICKDWFLVPKPLKVCVCVRVHSGSRSIGIVSRPCSIDHFKMVLVLLLYELQPTSTISLPGFACKFTLHPCILLVLISDRWLLDHGSQGRAVVTCSRWERKLKHWSSCFFDIMCGQCCQHQSSFLPSLIPILTGAV